jgi:general secretion pathway protein K
MTCADPRRGMVLVIALWTIALCSALAMATSVTFRSFAGMAGIDRDRIRGDALLAGGLEAAAGLAAHWEEKPLLQRETTVGLSTGTVRALVNDEGGRIDVGKSPPELLAALLHSVGAPQAEADGLAQSIARWRNRDPAQSPDQAQNTALPGASIEDSNVADSSGGFFTDVSQIAEVPGMRPEWVAAIRPLTTVFGAATINPLTASPDVVACLPGVDRSQLAAFLAARRSLPNDAAQLGAILGPAQRFVAAKPQRVVSVQLAATLADGYATAAHAVIVLLSNDKEPYRVLIWTPLSGSAVQ